MKLQTAIVALSAAGFATACTALIGLDDVPTPPVVDAGAPADGSPVVPPTTTDSGVVDAGNPLASAITAYANAYCTKYQSCFRTLFGVLYRDIDECTTSAAGYPIWASALPGFASTATDFQACATKTTALSCVAFESADAANACVLKGTRTNTQKCVANAQCASGVCASDLATCRTCVPAPDTGTACTANSQCGPGLVCTTEAKCVVQAGLNHACDDDTAPCSPDLICSSNVCAKPPAAVGLACDSSNIQSCDFPQGFACGESGCVDYNSNGAGGACGVISGVPTICRREAPCTGATCGTPPTEGQPCGDGSGNCLAPLSCFNGKCTAPAPSSFCE